MLLPTDENVELALEPRVVMAAMQTTMIRASMTAYSTAVGPSSAFRKFTSRFAIPRMTLSTPGGHSGHQDSTVSSLVSREPASSQSDDTNYLVHSPSRCKPGLPFFCRSRPVPIHRHFLTPLVAGGVDCRDNNTSGRAGSPCRAGYPDLAGRAESTGREGMSCRTLRGCRGR